MSDKVGDLHLCSWAREGKVYTCWVKETPELRGEGDSFEAADAELIDRISEATDDFRPLLEYIPAIPTSAFDDLFRGSDWVAIKAPNELVASTLKTTDLFMEGMCPLCRTKKGSRNNLALKVQRFSQKKDGALVNVRPTGHTIPIFSEEFLELLSPDEKANLIARPVESEIASKRNFYEVECFKSTEVVFVKGINISGWKCDECKKNVPRAYSHYSETAINYFVTNPPSANCLTVCAPDKSFFCLPRRRWEEIAGKIGTKGLAASPIGVVPAHLVDVNPKVELVSDIIKKYGRF